MSLRYSMLQWTAISLSTIFVSKRPTLSLQGLRRKRQQANNENLRLLVAVMAKHLNGRLAVEEEINTSISKISNDQYNIFRAM